jgi:hypothetical protein
VSKIIPTLNRSTIGKLTDVCERGKAVGVLRLDADPAALHRMTSSASFRNLSKRATISTLFRDRVSTGAGRPMRARRGWPRHGLPPCLGLWRDAKPRP